jgi:hypothetical protein
MQGWHDATQLILHILSNPAWGGIGVIISSAISVIAIILTRQSKARQRQTNTKLHRKKSNIAEFFVNIFARFWRFLYILSMSQPQELQNMHIPPGEIRHFIRGGYRRATLVKEFVNDVAILVVVDPKKLAS